MLVQLLLFNIGAHDERKRLCCVCMLLLAGGLLSTPPAWTVRSPTGIYTSFHRESSAIGFSRMSLHTIHSSESLAQSYAGIFAQSPGIAKAWAVPHIEEDTETVILQRTARDIEGEFFYVCFWGGLCSLGTCIEYIQTVQYNTRCYIQQTMGIDEAGFSTVDEIHPRSSHQYVDDIVLLCYCAVDSIFLQTRAFCGSCIYRQSCYMCSFMCWTQFASNMLLFRNFEDTRLLPSNTSYTKLTPLRFWDGMTPLLLERLCSLIMVSFRKNIARPGYPVTGTDPFYYMISGAWLLQRQILLQYRPDRKKLG